MDKVNKILSYPDNIRQYSTPVYPMDPQMTIIRGGSTNLNDNHPTRRDGEWRAKCGATDIGNSAPSDFKCSHKFDWYSFLPYSLTVGPLSVWCNSTQLK